MSTQFWQEVEIPACSLKNFGIEESISRHGLKIVYVGHIESVFSLYKYF